MIELPDFSIPFDHENSFYLTCKPRRLSKVLAHFELYKLSLGLAGDIVECGVFKGVSFARWAMLRELFEGPSSRKIIGFDTFGRFPDTENDADRPRLKRYLDAAGDQSISPEQLHHVLENKGINRDIELIAGDIRETVPTYVESNQERRISLLNLDTDLYEPAVAILEHLYPLIVPGGVLILDDYGVWPGETKAVDEFFAGQDVTIRKFSYAPTPCYIVKETT